MTDRLFDFGGTKLKVTNARIEYVDSQATYQDDKAPKKRGTIQLVLRDSEKLLFSVQMHFGEDGWSPYYCACAELARILGTNIGHPLVLDEGVLLVDRELANGKHGDDFYRLKNWLVRVAYDPETMQAICLGHIMANNWFDIARRRCDSEPRVPAGGVSDGTNMLIARQPEIVATDSGISLNFQLVLKDVVERQAAVRFLPPTANPGLDRPLDMSAVGPTLSAILGAIGVSKWSGLKGRYVRVRRGMDGTEIGHLLEDRWFTTTNYGSF